MGCGCSCGVLVFFSRITKAVSSVWQWPLRFVLYMFYAFSVDWQVMSL